jgi:hypothetical protein
MKAINRQVAAADQHGEELAGFDSAGFETLHDLLNGCEEAVLSLFDVVVRIVPPTDDSELDAEIMAPVVGSMAYPVLIESR